MGYTIHYICLSHVGNIRSMNQDNFICNGKYMDLNCKTVLFPLSGSVKSKSRPIFGVFDGMGGEECGEIASFLAAKDAARLSIGKNAVSDFSQFCYQANHNICDYAASHDIFSMGTTAAMLAFTDQGIALCNIGDSKVFRLSEGTLEQISVDHLSKSAYGVKPPLSQNLGIPPDEMMIEPYLAQGDAQDGDMYLICSDGLTDMVSIEEISHVLTAASIREAASLLLDKALANGGKDNITILLCKIESWTGWLFRQCCVQIKRAYGGKNDE